MKTILQLITLMYSIGSFACDCVGQNFTEKYTSAEFVAVVTITKIYPNEKGSSIYRADIKINELFKGEKLTHIFVYGRTDGTIGSSCDIYIPEKAKLIVYSRKNNDGKFGISACSGYIYLNYSSEKFVSRELEILKMFKSKKINFTDKTSYSEKGTLPKKLKEFKGIKLTKKYAFFEITFSSDLVIKEVKKISGFGDSIDDDLIQILKETKWSSNDSGIKDKVPENSKLIIGIYYYESEKGNQSFLSNLFV